MSLRQRLAWAWGETIDNYDGAWDNFTIPGKIFLMPILCLFFPCFAFGPFVDAIIFKEPGDGEDN